MSLGAAWVVLRPPTFANQLAGGKRDNQSYPAAAADEQRDGPRAVGHGLTEVEDVARDLKQNLAQEK